MRRIHLIVLLLLPIAAAAAPRGAEKKARAHYNAAQGFFGAGEYDRAVVEFKAAYDLVARPRLLFNIGSAYRRKAEDTGALDDKQQAAAHYRKYLEAEPNGPGAKDARAYLVDLDADIARLEAARPAAPAPEEAPRPPPLPETGPGPTTASPAAPTAPAVDVAPPASSGAPYRTPYRIAGIATAGVGVGLVGVGVYFGLKAKSAKDDLAALESGGRWDQGLYDDGKAADRNMKIFVGAGAAAIVAGTVIYFVLGRDRESVAVVPGPGSLTVAGRF